ncbi:thimet oligopeptidase [Bryocella elongata]|uniref:Thimet oligopeptidase n=1 Tax=Bryocella elongata TaxID=863522 RepID=A0A1H6C917_9BACT|nr:M3 family metallopeptidase [Bryocella elongata]SEG69470.1 thimet oligopeptidase [Bryocella elongata]
MQPVAEATASTISTDPLHIWAGLDSAEGAKTWVESHLAAARAAIAELLAVDANSARTVLNTLEPYDRASWHLRMAGSQAHVMFMVHPLAGVRDVAQELSQSVSAESVALSLNREVYQALAALEGEAITGEDAATRYYLERVLLGYRMSGVDRDDETREKIRSLADTMIGLSMNFSRTVQDDVRKVEVTDANELLGLPADYLTRKGVREEAAADGTKTLAADGPVTITTDPPDMTPVMNYAASPALRRKLYLAYNGRGYPANKQVLLDLLAGREEMAKLLGFRSWADLATVDQMMGSAANMRKFLDEVEVAAREFATREYAELETFVRERDPHALPLTLSDARYWEEQFRRTRYNFDSQSVRPYFPYEQVEAGILATVEKLFRVRFVRDTQAPVWDPSVKAFLVYDTASNTDQRHPERSAQREVEGPATTLNAAQSQEPFSPEPSPLGRIYLDMHPREGKSKWFSECSLVSGVLGKNLPEASLVCNFPQPSESDAGLMQYSDVVTYFHEFGHLMHEVLGGRQRWAGQSGIATEGDFVEVPSQMLEEFFEDADLLRTFAKHYQTGELLPYDVIERMTKAAAHGRALSTLTQVMYATYSMETHDRKAADLDLDLLLRAGYDRFSRYEFVEGNTMYAAFTHLIGYTSNYYTYLYDKVMALEFFEQFSAIEAKAAVEDAKGEGAQHATELLTSPVALRYRREVLEPGGTKPARELVQAFLGRESSMEALRGWIGKEFAA